MPINYHPIVVHFPVALLPLALIFVALHWGLGRRFGWLSSAGLTLAGVGFAFAYLAMVTGNWVGEVVEKQPGVREAVLEEHEGAGQFIGILGLVALILLVLILLVAWRSPAVRGRAVVLAELVTLVVLVVLVPLTLSTAKLGGELVYEMGAGVKVLGGPGAPPVNFPQLTALFGEREEEGAEDEVRPGGIYREEEDD